jgi:hypothetical protein
VVRKCSGLDQLNTSARVLVCAHKREGKFEIFGSVSNPHHLYYFF